jgi:co-chaperonin GroES (HSP10)
MITPILDRIVVRPLKETVSAGGIALLPHEDTELVKEIVHGEIVSVGPGKFDKKGRRESMWGLKPGDRIAHSPVGQVKASDGLVVIRRDAVVGLTSYLEAA